MEELKQYKAYKSTILAAMRKELVETPAEDRYYTEININHCEQDLDKYIDKLIIAQDAENMQKEIAKSVRWIHKQLSTFGNKEEEGFEELWGFLYNGYTEKLTNYILDAAFTAGLKKAKPETVHVNICQFEYHVSIYKPYVDIRIYMGKDDDHGIILLLNNRTGCFEYEANPYGESHGIPLFNLHTTKDYSELSFEILSTGSYKTYKIKAEHATDHILIKLISQIHRKGVSYNEWKPNHSQIELSTNTGRLNRISTILHDNNGQIIPLNGMSMFRGNDGKLFAAGEEIQSVRFQENQITLTTSGKEIQHPVFTIPLIRKFIKEIIEKNNEKRILSSKELNQYKTDKKSILSGTQKEQAFDKYIDKLITAQGFVKKQPEIIKSIRWIYKQLRDVIYNGNTTELSRFILDAAFTAGLKKDKSKNIKTEECILDYEPFIDDYSLKISFAKGSTGVILHLNSHTGYFQYQADPSGVPILNVQFNKKTAELSFEVVDKESYKTFNLKPQYETDRVFLRLIHELHGIGLPRKELQPDHGNIEICTEEGRIERLINTAYDNNHYPLPQGDPETGINLSIQYYNEKGDPVIKSKASLPIIVADDFVIIEIREKDDSNKIHVQYLSINRIQTEDNRITVSTPEKELHYTIHTLPLLMDYIKEIIEKREPFTSKYIK